MYGWNYHQTIEVDGSSSEDGVNYVVTVIIPYSTGKMRSDFGDIRFCDEEDNEHIYTLLSKEDGVEAVFDVKIPLILQNDSVNLLIYAGNPSATTTSDPENTYLEFDNFPGSTLDTEKWNVVGSPTITVDDGLKIERSGSYSGETTAGIRSIATFSNKTRVKARVKRSNQYYYSGSLVSLINSAAQCHNSIGLYGYDANIDLQTDKRACSGDVATAGIKAYAVDQFYDISLGRYGTTLYGSADDTNVNTSSQVITSAGSVGLLINAWGGSSVLDLIAEYIAVQPFIYPEPTVGELGEWEEEVVFTEDLPTLIKVPTYIGWLSGWQDGQRSEIIHQGSTDGAKVNEILEVQIPYEEGLMREDFGDIRFTSNNGITLLDYTLVNITPEPPYTAIFHVRVPGVPAYPDEIVIYAYSGNLEATDASNPKETYNVYDDFETGIDNDLWVYNHGVEESGGNAVLDYHSNNENGNEDYIATGAVIEEGTKTIFQVQPETLDGPFRFGLYKPNGNPSSSRTTFSAALLEYIGVVLSNEYITTNHHPGNLHNTIQTYDVVDHIFEIIWLEDELRIYYDGELIHTYTNNLTAEALNLLIRDRGFLESVYSYNYSENPPILISQGPWERPSAYLDTYINVPPTAALKTLIEVYPVSDSLETLVTVRQIKDFDLETLIKALPPNVNLKTLINVIGLYSDDLNTLINVPSPFTFYCDGDLDTKIEVPDLGFDYGEDDLLTRIQVGRIVHKQLQLKWNVVPGNIQTEGSDSPKFIMEVDGEYYA